MSEEKSTSKKKVLTASLAVGLAAAMLIGGGSFAYLRDSSEDVVNDFATNKVTVDLAETKNDYSIVPGTTQTKDPKVTVDNTVDAYAYVEVIDNTNGMVTYTVDSSWTKLDGVDNVYYTEVAANAETKSFNVLTNNEVTYDKTLENSDMIDESGNLKENVTLSFKATAMQKAPFNDPVKAYFQTDSIVKVESTDTVSAVNTKISEAVNSANGEPVAVVISNNITDTEPVVVPAGSDVTISLDKGAKITNSTAKSAVIDNSGSLSVIGGTLDATAHQSAAIKNEVGATAELEGVTLIRSQEAGTYEPYGGNGNSYYVILNHGTMTLTNCDIEADGGYSSLIENGWFTASDNTTKAPSKLTINSGTYTGGVNTVKNDEYGELIINGGTFTNVAQYAVMNYNVATINGGTFTTTANSAIYNCYYDADTSIGQLTVNGGTFSYPEDKVGIKNITNYGTDGVVTINGGTFATENKTDYKPTA